MTTILSAEGLLQIPEAFRKADALQPGQRCEIERVGRGEYRVRVTDAAKPKGRLIDVTRNVDDFTRCGVPVVNPFA